MIVKKEFLERNDIYTFSKEDKIKIESQDGKTQIYINDKPLKFIKKFELIHEAEKMPELKIRKFITSEELKEYTKIEEKT